VGDFIYFSLDEIPKASNSFEQNGIKISINTTSIKNGPAMYTLFFHILIN
jgi:hypothetical protein